MEKKILVSIRSFIVTVDINNLKIISQETGGGREHTGEICLPALDRNASVPKSYS